jgi:hypothetical protein
MSRRTIIFSLLEIGEGFRLVNIKRRTIRRDPVFLRALPVEPCGQERNPYKNASLRGDIPAKSWCIHPRLGPWASAAGVSLPKAISPFRIGDIHGID